MVTATRFTNTITTIDQLREFIPPPSKPALAKEIAYVDEHAPLHRTLAVRAHRHIECGGAL